MFYLQKLRIAAWNGDIQTLKLCLQNDADIDYQDVSKIITFKICRIMYNISNHIPASNFKRKHIVNI